MKSAAHWWVFKILVSETRTPKIIKYCNSCDEGFAQRFDFCPICGAQLDAFEMVSQEKGSIISSEHDTSSPSVELAAEMDLAPTLTQPTTSSQPVSSKNLEKTFSAKSVPSTDADSPSTEYGGIGRLGYFLAMFALGFFNAVLSGSRSRFDDEPSQIVPLIGFVIALILTGYRLKNIGISSWWALLWLVPLVNLGLGYVCLTRQEGYVETLELDGPGKIVRFIYIVFGVFVLIVILAAFCGGR